MKPQALFLTHSPPRPVISGDRIRTFHLMRELRDRGWHVSLFSLVAPAEPAGIDAHLAEAADSSRLVPHIVNRPRRLARLGTGLLRQRAFQRDWFWSRDAAKACHAWLEAAPRGILFVEQLYMFPYVPESFRERVVLDTQNLEVARIRAMGAADSSLARRAVAWLQLRPVERYETEAVQSVARVLAVSKDEQAAFEKLAPGRVRLVPNGVDTRAIEPLATTPQSRKLLYLGSMGYGPNVDAVTHFLGAIAPRLRADGPSLDVVGSSPPASVYRAAAQAQMRVTVSGFVPDVSPYYRDSRAMVVPIRHGGGTRLKILESLGWGLPVVTTSLGCAGLGLTDGREALIADTPQEFAAAVDRLLIDDQLWIKLSRAGRAYVERHFDWKTIGGTLDGIMRELQPTR